jgi:hypothetical protein
VATAGAIERVAALDPIELLGGFEAAQGLAVELEFHRPQVLLHTLSFRGRPNHENGLELAFSAAVAELGAVARRTVGDAVSGVYGLHSSSHTTRIFQGQQSFAVECELPEILLHIDLLSEVRLARAGANVNLDRQF